MTKLICTIYRSTKKEELYLYVAKKTGLAEVPPALLEHFGVPQEAFTLLLTPERKLAKEDSAAVISSIQEKGYFLQMPPLNEADSEMRRLAEQNSKLSAGV